jgi:hypothetical protein
VLDWLKLEMQNGSHRVYQASKFKLQITVSFEQPGTVGPSVEHGAGSIRRPGSLDRVLFKNPAL